MARIAGCFGVAGELKCDPTDTARELFVPGARFRSNASHAAEVRVRAVRAHAGRLLVRLEGIEDRTAAQAYVGATLYAPREALALAAGEYLDNDLIGFTVFDTAGRARGTVERVEHYPASDMLVVAGRMIPMVSAIVRDVDLAGKRITVDPPEGLLE